MARREVLRLFPEIKHGFPLMEVLATINKIEVHGVLWVVDEIHRGRLTTTKAIHTALTLLGDDPAVRLPKRELAAAIDRFAALL